MLTQHEVNAYLAEHPCIKGQRTKWILEAIKHFDALRWTEIQRLWVTSQGEDYDKMEYLQAPYDEVLGRHIEVGPRARVHRGRGCDYLGKAHGKQGVLPRYCEKRGNKYYVVKPIVGPWNPESKLDMTTKQSFFPEPGQYGIPSEFYS